MIEIINECIFLIMVATIVEFDKESEWSDGLEQVYTGLILGNSAIITVVMISKVV